MFRFTPPARVAAAIVLSTFHGRLGYLAYIPDEAVLRQYAELTPAASALYNYYCKKRNKNSGGYSCPIETVLAELRGLTRTRYFGAKKELITKRWITANGNFVSPIVGFRPDDESPKNGTQADDKSPENGTLEEGQKSQKVNSESQKVNSHNKEYTSPSLPAHITSPSNGESEERDSIPAEERNGPENPVEIDVETLPTKERAQMVFERWKVVTDHPQARFSDDRRKKIEARLQGKDPFTVAELVSCLEGWKLSSYHQGENPQGQVYDKIETIFKNASTVESHIARLTTTPRQQQSGNRPPENDDMLSENYAAPVAPMTFADEIQFTFDICPNDGNPIEQYEQTKKNYLEKNPEPKFVGEVASYEASNDYRQRFSQAGS